MHPNMWPDACEARIDDGSWEVAAACSDGGAVRGFVEAACSEPSSFEVIEVLGSGALSVHSKAFSFDYSFSTTLRWQVPASCVEPFGSCQALGEALESAIPAGARLRCEGMGDCVCTIAISDVSMTDTGTVATDGAVAELKSVRGPGYDRVVCSRSGLVLLGPSDAGFDISFVLAPAD